MENTDTYRKWCWADTLLIIAGIVFLISLGLEIAFPDQIVFEGLHYIADATLVGAFADYFAVTAIFRHPLGLLKIKGVTGLLPNQREKFSEGAVKLLKEELVTTKVLLRAIHRINLVDKLTEFLSDKKRQEETISQLLDIIQDTLESSNRGKYTNELASALRSTLQETSPRRLIRQGLEWIKKDRNGATFFKTLAPLLENYLKTPNFYRILEDAYETLSKQPVDNNMILTKFKYFVIDKLKDYDTINTKELAEQTQQHLADMAGELGCSDSPLQAHVIRLITEHGDRLMHDREFCKSIAEFRQKLLKDVPFEESLQDVFAFLWKRFGQDDLRQSIKDTATKALHSNVADIIREQLILMAALLGKDEKLRTSLEKFLREVATLSSVEGRDIAIDVIQKKLNEKTDEDINRLVWNKFDNDLIFIRINGTIIGFAAGILLFLISCIAEMFMI